LDALFARWIEFIDIRPASVEIYASATRLFLRWLRENGIANPRREDILAYRRYLEMTRKPTTVQLYIIAVRQFFAWLEIEGIYKNIVQHVKSPKIERLHKKDYLTSSQAKNVLGRIERQTERGRRDYAMLSLMVTGGLRRIEVSRANIEDIRTVGDSTRLYIQGKGKDERADYVKLPQPVELAVRDYLSARGKPVPTAPLFVSTSNNNHGERLTVRSISGIVKERLRAAGYDSDRLTAHSLRHSAVTLALLSGQSLQDVQQFARHTAITTTMIYAHNIDRENNRCAESVAEVIFA
jgi:integrase/recombinase XerC